MGRNKYLEELGLKREHYDPTYKAKRKQDKQHIAKRMKNYGFMEDECYDLDYHHACWLFSHLCQYLKDASKALYLDDKDERYDINGVDYTLEAAIKEMIHSLGVYLLDHNKGENYLQSRAELEHALRIYMVVHRALWW